MVRRFTKGATMNLKHPVMTKSIYKDFKIGDYTYGHPRILGAGELEIGRFCSIADGCLILLGVDHRTDWGTTYPFSALFSDAQNITGHPKNKGPVIIGHDVWIAQNVTLLSGITIGNGAVIAAGSVVTKDVEPYSIVAGNPATHRKFRFGEEWIDAFQRKIQWWDWPIDKILENVSVLLRAPGDHLIPFFKSRKEYEK